MGEPKEGLLCRFWSGERHFVSAMQEAGLAICCGYEVSKARVRFPSFRIKFGLICVTSVKS